MSSDYNMEIKDYLYYRVKVKKSVTCCKPFILRHIFSLHKPQKYHVKNYMVGTYYCKTINSDLDIN